jgi:hypothetical protein
MMKSRLSIILAFFPFIFFLPPASAHDPFDDIEIKVWSSQSFDDPFCSDDPVDIYFRVNRASYVTVYQINPWGGVDIIYPRPHHRWLPVQPGRAHRLVDVAADLELYYGGAEGRAYIGIIATRHPIDIVPWLEAGFRDRGVVCGRPSHVSVNVDFNLVINRVLADVRVRLGSACAPLTASHRFTFDPTLWCIGRRFLSTRCAEGLRAPVQIQAAEMGL